MDGATFACWSLHGITDTLCFAWQPAHVRRIYRSPLESRVHSFLPSLDVWYFPFVVRIFFLFPRYLFVIVPMALGDRLSDTRSVRWSLGILASRLVTFSVMVSGGILSTYSISLLWTMEGNLPVGPLCSQPA